MAETISATPATPAAANPAATPSEPANTGNVGTATTTTTPKTGGEAPTQGQAAPATETFTQVDANSLTPTDRAAYDNMLRDYKKKTAEIAEIRKKADAYDAWQKQQAARAGITDDDFNRAFESKDGYLQFLQKASQPVVQELNATRQELAMTKADLFVKDFKAKHPDFDELDQDGLITGYVQLNPPTTEQEWDSRMKDGYQYAKKLRSKWEDVGYKRGITRVQEKAEQSTELPTGSPAQVYPGGDPTKITAKEAVELAMRGIKVPRS